MTITLNLWQKRALFFVDGEIPEQATSALRDNLSYSDPDAQWTDAWRAGEWNGEHYLFQRAKSSGNWFFPIGLLPKVSEILHLHGVDYSIEGLERERGSIEYGWPDDLQLREYQKQAVADAISAGGGLIVMPTGAGKTVCGLRLAHELRHPFIVFCHTVEIAEQWCGRIENRLGVEPARYFGGDREQGDVMVGLYQSIYENSDVRKDIRLDHPVGLWDECHRVAARTFEQVALACNAKWRFGFTATPSREDNADLRILGGVGEIVCDLSVERLIEDGYLAEPTWRLIEVPRVDGTFRVWQAEYRAAVVENGERNRLVADAVTDAPAPCLVTVEQIAHGERLGALLAEREIDVLFTHGSDADRDETIAAFRAGELDVLIATRGIVGEGFDVPEIASFVVAGGRKSSVAMIQQVGRALRPDTDRAVIVDFLDRGSAGYKSWVGKHAEERLRVYREYYKSFGP